MKKVIAGLFLLAFVVLSGFKPKHPQSIEFICLKTHKASNTCHFNFKVDGAKYRYVDIGCKYSKKVEDLVKKVNEGTIYLSKDWKIECPEPKQ